MIIAREADDDVTAAASGPEYPRFFICGINTEPSAATSATAEPDISAKEKTDTDVDHCEAATHKTDDGVHKVNEFVGDAAGIHDCTSQDKHWDGDQ